MSRAPFILVDGDGGVWWWPFVVLVMMRCMVLAIRRHCHPYTSHRRDVEGHCSCVRGGKEGRNVQRLFVCLWLIV